MAMERLWSVLVPGRFRSFLKKFLEPSETVGRHDEVSVVVLNTFYYLLFLLVYFYCLFINFLVEVLNSKSIKDNIKKSIKMEKKKNTWVASQESFMVGSTTFLPFWFGFNESVGIGISHSICFVIEVF